MKVLILGNGGREHAIALAVSKSPLCSELLCAPGNPGTAALGRNLPVLLDDPQDMLRLANAERVDFTIVGPELPLVAGVVDLFRQHGLAIFGPASAAAALEGSKSFAKDLMRRYRIPTADYATFTDLRAALAYLDTHPAPIVVKASGLAAGKGAVVCMTDAEAREAVKAMLGPQAIFGESGKTVVIEEFMRGEEASIFAVCDGKNYVVLASAQDHKRVFDDDQGPNTGGMGAYAPAPIVTPELIECVCKTIIEPTLTGMSAEGCPYTGVLYTGIMVTAEGPKVVEFNCRLGDPETQVVLPLYDGDILELFLAATRGELQHFERITAPRGCAAVVVMASAGYPSSYSSGKLIQGIAQAEAAGAVVLHAGTRLNDAGQLVSAGGRVLGVTGHGASLREALNIAYRGAAEIHFDGCHYRKDIGKKGLERLAGT